MQLSRLSRRLRLNESLVRRSLPHLSSTVLSLVRRSLPYVAAVESAEPLPRSGEPLHEESNSDPFANISVPLPKRYPTRDPSEVALDLDASAGDVGSGAAAVKPSLETSLSA